LSALAPKSHDVTQRRITGAEVVYGDTRADLRKPLQDRADIPRVLHQEALGDFELDQAGIDTVPVEDGRNVVDQRRRELANGEIDRHRLRRDVAPAPVADLLAGVLQHPPPDVDDQAGVLGHGNEPLRGYHAPRGMAPAQRLETADLAARMSTFGW
jgi:hypothetical protein